MLRVEALLRRVQVLHGHVLGKIRLSIIAQLLQIIHLKVAHQVLLLLSSGLVSSGKLVEMVALGGSLGWHTLRCTKSCGLRLCLC